jgi:hypothetical protein
VILLRGRVYLLTSASAGVKWPGHCRRAKHSEHAQINAPGTRDWDMYTAFDRSIPGLISWTPGPSIPGQSGAPGFGPRPSTLGQPGAPGFGPRWVYETHFHIEALSRLRLFILTNNTPAQHRFRFSRQQMFSFGRSGVFSNEDLVMFKAFC